MKLLVAWLIRAATIFVLPYILSGVELKSFATAAWVALLVAFLNTFIKPVLFVLTLPVTIVTLGLFMLVLNGLVFWVVSRLVDGFFIAGFGWAVLAAIVYSLISWAIEALLVRETVDRNAH